LITDNGTDSVLVPSLLHTGDRQECLTLKGTKKNIKSTGYNAARRRHRARLGPPRPEARQGVESFGVSDFKSCAAIGANTLANGKFVIFGDLSKAALFD